MDPNVKAIVDGIPDDQRKAVWHALGEEIRKAGGAHTEDDSPDPSGDNRGKPA